MRGLKVTRAVPEKHMINFFCLICIFLFRSPNPRRAAVLNYFGDGTCSNSDEELLAGTGIIKKVTLNT